MVGGFVDLQAVAASLQQIHIPLKFKQQLKHMYLSSVHQEVGRYAGSYKCDAAGGYLSDLGGIV